MTARVWTDAEVRAHGVRMSGLVACAIVLGTARSKSYELLKSGNVPFKTIRVPGTNRYVVPTSEVLKLMGMDSREVADR